MQRAAGTAIAVTGERVDVAIVGAGPAGSTAAYRLASAGARVLLLDRQRFPRDKPCGGGLTMRGIRLLPFDVSPVVEDRVDRVMLRLRFERSAEQRFAAPVAFMTQRRRLDQFLVERAAEAGADFRDGVRVRGIEPDGDAGMVVDVEGARIHAGLVIGADGANGVCSTALGLGADSAFAVAYEGNLHLTGASAAEHRGRVTLELGTVPGGYGWLFPKGDHVNLGVGGWGERARACAITCAASARLTVWASTTCPPSAGTACRCGAPGGCRPAAGPPSSATPPAWSTRCRATACSRRSSAPSS